MIEENDNVCKHTGFKLLKYRSDKMNSEKDSYDIESFTAKWKSGIDLSELRPRKIHDKAGHVKKKN